MWILVRVVALEKPLGLALIAEVGAVAVRCLGDRRT
jgi:hypothetical protein